MNDSEIHQRGLDALKMEQEREQAHRAGHTRKHCRHLRHPHAWKKCPGNVNREELIP